MKFERRIVTNTKIFMIQYRDFGGDWHFYSVEFQTLEEAKATMERWNKDDLDKHQDNWKVIDC